MHVAMVMIRKTLNYTAVMLFVFKFAVNVNPGEFELLVQVLREEKERIFFILALRLHEVKSMSPQLVD